MKSARLCSKTGCTRPAVATFTYDYADSTAVVGPLATIAEPHAYDLCEEHARTLTVPKGWQVIRLQTDFDPAPVAGDDLEALADAVRMAAQTAATPRERHVESTRPGQDSLPKWGPFGHSGRAADADREAAADRGARTAGPLHVVGGTGTPERADGVGE